jgi:hypothetical protein
MRAGRGAGAQARAWRRRAGEAGRGRAGGAPGLPPRRARAAAPPPLHARSDARRPGRWRAAPPRGAAEERRGRAGGAAARRPRDVAGPPLRGRRRGVGGGRHPRGLRAGAPPRVAPAPLGARSRTAIGSLEGCCRPRRGARAVLAHAGAWPWPGRGPTAEGPQRARRCPLARPLAGAHVAAARRLAAAGSLSGRSPRAGPPPGGPQREEHARLFARPAPRAAAAAAARALLAGAAAVAALALWRAAGG